jgi:ribosome-associated toxin RatA of RatAB toxin-antitoxin module
MSTKVEKRILVNVPVSTAYNQWTQFEEFPHFMGGVKSVKQTSDDQLEWVAEVAGVRRQWTAKVLEQIPDRKVAWAATEGATNAGAVEFEDVGGGQTSLRLTLEYEPEGIIEKVGDKLNVVDRQAEADLQRFKEFIEDAGYATGAWRGSVNEGASVGTPGVGEAGASRGDSGKAGISGKMAAAAGAAAVAGAAAAMAAGGNKETPETGEVRVAPLPEPVTGEPAPIQHVPTDSVTSTTSDLDTGTGSGMGAGTVAAAGSTVGGADRAPGHPFDQTNGLVDVEGESDGTAEGEIHSSAKRNEETGPGGIPPFGGSGQH